MFSSYTFTQRHLCYACPLSGRDPGKRSCGKRHTIHGPSSY